MVKVIGTFTLETVPGLKRHLRKVVTAELSRIGFPVLWAIEASVALPLAESTLMTQTPLPVIFDLRAS